MIADWGTEAAQRYIDHEAVEAHLGITIYDECADSIGRRPPVAKERADVKAVYDAVIAKYGNDFATGYGWAGGFLANKRPTFRTLEDAANLSAMRAYYKIASYNVHAGVKGITSQLGAMGEPGLGLAGASNAGHGEPSERVALDLVALTVLLYQGDMNLDELVRLQAMRHVADSTSEAVARAEWLLDRDERFLRMRAH